MRWLSEVSSFRMGGMGGKFGNSYKPSSGNLVQGREFTCRSRASCDWPDCCRFGIGASGLQQCRSNCAIFRSSICCIAPVNRPMLPLHGTRANAVSMRASMRSYESYPRRKASAKKPLSRQPALTVRHWQPWCKSWFDAGSCSAVERDTMPERMPYD